jgi:dihydrofolate synthase / folylpolyglutamate synthase
VPAASPAKDGRKGAAGPTRADGSSAYRTTLDQLFQRRRFGLRPGLEAIHALLEGLGHPERAYPAVHVTGSKGKGSVAVMTQAILSAQGLRTGLFTSPHLVSYRERIQRDGQLIPAADVVAGLDRVDALTRELLSAGRLDREPTFFEATTALALDWFAREHVDAAVVEVGVGGRLDATNVLESRVGVLTTIELEHTDILGPTLRDIAREKSGILHPGMTAIVGEVPDEPRRTIESAAQHAGTPVWQLGEEIRVRDRELSAHGQTFQVRLPGRAWLPISLPLLGRFQPGNAALAIAAADRFATSMGREVDPSKTRRALADVRWPARLERRDQRPELFYDVAHTPESARAVAESLAEISPLADPASSAIVFGCLKGKDVPRILDHLAPLARTLVVVPVRSARGLGPGDIRAAAVGRFPRVVIARSAAEGLTLGRAATGPEGYTLVVGSDYLVGELLRTEQDDLEEPDLSDPGLGDRPPDPADPAGPVPDRAAARRR